MILSSKLRDIKKRISQRRRVANYYKLFLEEHFLNGDLLSIPNDGKNWQHSYHLYVIRLIPNEIKLSHKEIHTKLIEKGINVNLHYYPVHLQPFYRTLGFKENMFPVSENYAKQAISIPIFPGLTENQQSYVVEEISKIIN